MEQIILNGLSKDEFSKLITQCVENAIKLNSSTDKPEQLKENFLSRKEVAKLLKISLPTLHDWSKTGLLISHRIGKRILYKLDEVNQAIEKRNFNLCNKNHKL